MLVCTFNLKTSEMSYLVISASFEYLCYESTAIIYLNILSAGIDVRFSPRTERDTVLMRL